MSLPPFARLLLGLYPRRFRERFSAEWGSIVEWHRRSLSGARLPRLRLALLLAADTGRTLPGAWVAALREAARTVGRPDAWLGDLRHALRGLARNPVFAWTTVVSVALGVGANAAAFSVVDAVLLRPLPYPEPERLAIVWNEFPGAGMARLPLSGVEVESLRAESAAFEAVGGIWGTSGTVVDAEERVTQVSRGSVTPDFFSVLGVEPALGPGFVRDASDGAEPRGVILSHELWTSRFGGDPALVGRTIRLNGRDREVVGVMPAGFTLFFPEDGAIPARIDVYSPLPWDLALLPPAQHFLRVVARLRPGVDAQAAAAAATVAADRARETWPELQATGDRFAVEPLHADVVRAARPVLLALLGGVGLFLLLACANVANLLVARTATRARELAVRASLGASRARLARLVVAESLVVTVVGAAVGLSLGWVGADALWALRPEGLARADMGGLDGRVLAFTAGVSAAAGVLVTLATLGSLASTPPAEGLRSGSLFTRPGGRRFREIATAGEVAIGVVLVVGSALMVQSLARLGSESVGFEPEGGLTFKVALDLRLFPDDGERARVAAEIDRRLAARPGVVAAGATSHLPFAPWANWAEAAPPEGTPEGERAALFADMRAVTPSYFEAIGVERVAGRLLDEHDDGGAAPVVVVDETMARRAFGGADAVGRVLEPSRYWNGAFVPTHAVVVGVVRDVRDRSPSRPSEGQVFWPFAQSPRWELTWFVRAAGDPAALAEAVREEVAAVSPDLAVSDVRPMEAYVASATGLTRYLARVGSAFSAAALVMAALGLYGVVAFVTLQRSAELAMRMILGARREHVVRGVVGHGLRVGLLGVAGGLAAAVALARLLEGLVYGVRPHDPVTLAAVAALLLAIAVGASLGPARRATRTHPLSAVRRT